MRYRNQADRGGLPAGAESERGGLPAGAESERGDTLIEVLIATVIIALTVAALLGGLLTSLTGTTAHRSLTSLDGVLKSFADSTKYAVQLQPGASFTECAQAPALNQPGSYRYLSTPSPASGPSQTAVTIFGTGFAVNSPLSVALVPPPQTPALPDIPAVVTSGGTTSGSGAVATTFTVPPATAGLINGTTYQVKVKDATNTVSSAGGFQFTPGPAPVTTSQLANYKVGIQSIGWWNTTTNVFDPSTGVCRAADKSGIQQITLTGTAQDNSSETLSVVVLDPTTVAPAIVSANGATFTVGSAGSFTMNTSGYPPASITESPVTPPSWPSWLSFTDQNNGTAILAGTPTAGAGGTYAFIITASNSSGADTQNFTLAVDEAPGITSAPSTAFITGTASNFTVTTSGYPPPALTNATSGTCTESNLSGTGITFTDNGDGTATIADTTTTPGNVYTLCLNANNSIGNDTQKFTLTVHHAPVITSAPNTTFTTGTAGNFTVTTSGYPPPALTNATSGTCTKSNLSGTGITFTDNGDGTATIADTTTTPGNVYTLCLNANNSIGNDTQKFTLTVHHAPVITSAPNTTFTTGTAGNFTVTTSGYPPPALTNATSGTCTKSNLSGTGITFTDNGDGTATIADTTTTPGNVYTLCLNANNSIGNDTQKFTLTVHHAPLFTSNDNKTFTGNNARTFAVTTSGFPIPTLTHGSSTSCTESDLSTNSITFTDNGDGTATIADTTTTPNGTYTLCLNASNGVDPDAAQQFSLTVR